MSQPVTFLRKKYSVKLFAVAMLTLFSTALFMSQSVGAGQNTNQSSRKAAAKVKRVKATKVCMVNNTVFPNDQIPVQVDGRTYYGCCQMCKGRLQNDQTVRQAIDPVSKKPVDKAQAVIGAKLDGTVVYFESEKTLQKYNAGVGH
jgi:YHS domain-containing protein